MKKLLPVIIAVIGLVGGLAGGTMMKPAAIAADAHTSGAESDAHGADAHAKANAGHGEKATADHGGGHAKSTKGGNGSDYIYVGLEKPFFAPVLRNNNKHTLVRLDIHLEVPPELEDQVAKHEPKLRDSFLRAVMNFAHEGGFSRVHGSDGFDVLSDDLLLGARSVIGNGVRAVLIGEILTREG